MFDYIKLNLFQTTPKEVLENPLLEFVTDFNIDTGEIYRTRQTAIYHNPVNKGIKGTEVKIIIENEKYVKAELSLHKFWHAGNHTDYFYKDFLQTVYSLYQDLNINPFHAKIENLEFGVNIVPPVPPDELIFDWIINYKGKEFNSMVPPPPLGIVYFGNNYQLKIYNKGRQYNLPDSLIRYEYKAKRMWELNNQIRVYLLADLLQPTLMPLLRDKLLLTVNDLLIYDYRIRKNQVSASQRKYLKYDNPGYWRRLKKRSRKTHDYQRKQFKDLFKTNCRPFIGDQLKELIADKFNSLSDLKETNYLSGIWTEFYKRVNPESLANLTGGKDYCFSQINSYSIVLNTPNCEKRFCKSCGRDITGQKGNSVFCSEKVYGKEGKKCRNKDSNPRNRLLKMVQQVEVQPLLFDLETVYGVHLKTLGKQ